MNRDTKCFFNWYWQEATSDEKKLADRVSELENMFDDKSRFATKSEA